MFKRGTESYGKKEVHEVSSGVLRPFINRSSKLYIRSDISIGTWDACILFKHTTELKNNRHCQLMTCINFEKQLNIFAYVFFMTFSLLWLAKINNEIKTLALYGACHPQSFRRNGRCNSKIIPSGIISPGVIFLSILSDEVQFTHKNFSPAP